MAEDTGQERTEQPTPKRLRDARDEGQIPRSRELNTMMVMLAGATALILMGGQISGGISHVMEDGLTLTRQDVFDVNAMIHRLELLSFNALSTLLPFFVVVVIAAIVAPLALGGWSFSTKALAFKFDKLDPVKGLGRVFSWRGLVELLKALAKFIVIGIVTVLTLWLYADDLLSLGHQDHHEALVSGMKLITWSFLLICASLALIALVDVPFQIWYHARQLRMTRQEIKDELKQTDGNPQIKQHIRNMQYEMAQRRMMQEVPKADVVITNPTHYAVALRYDGKRMAAPVVVAKGMNLVAQEIRRVATEHHVPIVSAPPLARALHHTTELNREIPAGLYVAVAQVLAYVMNLKQKKRGDQAIEMADLPIPEDYRYND